MASPLLQEDHGTEAAAGSGAPSGHSLPVRHAQQLGQAQEWEPEGSGQRQQEAVLDAAQLASAGSMPFPDAHSLPIMDEAGLPGRGSSPPPAAAGAELRPFTGGGSGCVSLPDLSAAAHQRQQQEARRPARYARQSAGHHRQASWHAFSCSRAVPSKPAAAASACSIHTCPACCSYSFGCAIAGCAGCHTNVRCRCSADMPRCLAALLSCLAGIAPL